MKLSTLDPHWLEFEGRRVGLTFKCPHCSRVYLTCFSEGFPVFEKRWRTPDEESPRPGQYELLRQVLPVDDANQAVPSNTNARWLIAGESFDTLNITPSIDASASGHWHGWVTKGEAA